MLCGARHLTTGARAQWFTSRAVDGPAWRVSAPWPRAALGAMLCAMLKFVDITEVADAVGAAAYGRGTRYTQQHAVVRMAWDASENAE
jgi:hypothetical protein